MALIMIIIKKNVAKEVSIYIITNTPLDVMITSVLPGSLAHFCSRAKEEILFSSFLFSLFV